MHTFTSIPAKSSELWANNPNGEHARKGKNLFGPTDASWQGTLAAQKTSIGTRMIAPELNQEAIGEALYGRRGDHLDIGTYWGGTAIMAATLKPEGTIYTIDCYLTKDGEPSPYLADITGGIDSVFTLLMLNERIVRAVQKSHPLPWEGPFETVYIDGGHDYETVHQDWLNVRAITTKYVIFDDVTRRWPGVLKTWDEAGQDPRWRIVHLAGRCGVLERR